MRVRVLRVLFSLPFTHREIERSIGWYIVEKVLENHNTRTRTLANEENMKFTIDQLPLL